MKIRLLIYFFFLFISFRGYGQCTLNVTISKSAQAICSGNSITLTTKVSGGTAPFTYSWNTPDVTPSINVNKAGTYKVTVTDKAGCQSTSSIAIVTSTAPDPPAAKNVIVCVNSSATLKVTSPVSGAVYQWYDSDGTTFLQSGDTYTTGPITAATTYFVQATIGGCTSSQTPVNVSLTGKPSATGAIVCAGSVATLSVNSGDTFSWYETTTSTNVLGSNQNFTTPALNATKTYYVVVTSNGCTSARTPVTATVIQAPPPPTANNETICSGSSVTLHADAAAGVFDWFTVPTGGTSLISSPDFTTPPLTANTTYYVQTSINDCVSARIPVKVIVDAPPQPPVAQIDSTCYNTGITLTATTTPSGTYNWYTTLTGGPAVFTGVTYNAPPLKASTTFYVQAVNGACSSVRIPITVIVKPVLAGPSVAGAVICSGATADLTATSPGGTYKWYNVATGGTALSTTDSYITPALTANTTYYVQRTFDGCVSPRVPVTVTILPIPAAPTVANTSVCLGDAAALTANSPSNIFTWYDSPTGGTQLSSGKVFVTPPLTTPTTYYVETTNANGCISPRTAVTVTINPLPALPTASNKTVCPGTSAQLTASGTGTIKWYADPSGGTPIFTGNTFNTPILTTNTTYYVQASTATCSSGLVPVTVFMTSTYSPEFKYSSGTYCTSGPNQTPIINNPAGGTFSALPAGLVFVSTTTGEINVAASTPGIYAITFTSNAPCPTITSARLFIVTTPDATFTYGGPYCQDGTNPFPAFGPTSSPGVFSATPSGLVFLNSSTGEIDLSKSKAGNYTITNTIAANGVCPLVTYTNASPVIINEQVNITAGPDQTVPASSVVQLAGIISGGVTTGNWSGGTGTFANSSDPGTTYTPGTGEKTATLTLTSNDPPGVCGPQLSKVVITFVAAPAAPVVQVNPICAGNTATLSAISPGGTYEWYDVATGGTALKKNSASYTTDPLTVNKTYYVQTTVKGVTSARTAVTVTVNPAPAAPLVADAQACIGSATTLTANGAPAGSSYAWYNVPVGGTPVSTNNSYSTPVLFTDTSFYVETKTNSCTSPRTRVKITVNPIPNVTSELTGSACSGNVFSYTITADQPGATFTWSRATVTGISNPAVSSQTSATISETLLNTTINPINVTYSIVPMLGTCSGPSFNYTVTVYPQPIVTSTPPAPICNQTSSNYAIQFNTTPSFTWSRDAVPGISNKAVSDQASAVIREVLFNTTNAPVNVTYVYKYKTGDCSPTTFNVVVTVEPTAVVTSPTTSVACSDYPESYVITSNVPNATFVWSRSAAGGNPAISAQTSSTISETLVNTTDNNIKFIYNITPSVNGCTGTPFNDTVTLTPRQVKPGIRFNSPICEGSTLNLYTDAVPNATYLWTAPDGETFTDENPVIKNVTAAKYAGLWHLVTILKGVCQSQEATRNVMVYQPSTAIATKGPNPLVVCSKQVSITLDGEITGGTESTGQWSPPPNGGRFSDINDPHATYYFSPADTAAGILILTLNTTTKSDCQPSSSSLVIEFGPLPSVNAGPDLTVCSQDKEVKMFGRTLTAGVNPVWQTLTGTGHFISPNQLDATYVPSDDDIKKGSIQLILVNTNAGDCFVAKDTMVVKFAPPPTLNAGGVRYVLRGNTITLNPTVSDEDVTYQWSPNIDISNVNIKNPVVTGDVNRFYILTVTDQLGCVTRDTTLVVVSPEIKLTNTFTPNGDGINDLWEIPGLIAYTDATVDIFNRYGQKLFHSVGYPKAWDGTYNGQPVPAGVYYYIINTKVNNQVLSGYVTVIR